jgi:hypothetical protein
VGAMVILGRAMQYVVNWGSLVVCDGLGDLNAVCGELVPFSPSKI